LGGSGFTGGVLAEGAGGSSFFLHAGATQRASPKTSADVIDQVCFTGNSFSSGY
jgi:hypothetical protein